MKLRETKDEIVLIGDELRIVFAKGGRGLRPPLFYDCTTADLLARSLAWLDFETAGAGRTVRRIAQYRCSSVEAGEVALDLFWSVASCIDIVISFRSGGDGGEGCEVALSAHVAADWQEPFAFRALMLVPGRPTRTVRLAAGLTSGWTIDGMTFAVAPQPADSPPRVGILTPPGRVKLEHGRLKESGPVRCAPICLAYPPGLAGCLANRWDEKHVDGRFALHTGKEPVTSPFSFGNGGTDAPRDRAIQPPRYSLSQYLDYYLEFLDHDRMFIDLGSGFGLYHRGFFNCTLRPEHQAVYGAMGGKPIPSGTLVYRHPAIKAHLEDPKQYPTLIVYGTHATMGSPICDVVWGGAHNLQTAHFLFRQNALTDKAERIVHTLLHFRNRDGDGFQLSRGRSRGAFWNAYQPELDTFSSRYFRPLIGGGDQGLWCFYLAQLTGEGFSADPAIQQQVGDCCENYLLPLAEADVVHHAYRLNGKPGYTREHVPYTRPSPFALIMTALGFLAAYRLTGRARYRILARRLATRCVDRHYRRFDWGWQEYDTLGQDTMGMGRTLMALCELYQDLPLPALKESAENLAAYLYHCQHHVDLRLDRYMNNGESWGGAPENHGGFLHGYTYNSGQGLQTLTFRADLPEGLVRHFETFGGARTYESILKYFNVLTYQQVVRRDIPFGFGSTSEHLNLTADYVQDTFQVSNAMPYRIETLAHGLHLSTTNTGIEQIAPEANRLTVRFARTPHLRFSLAHPTATVFRIRRAGADPAVSFDGEFRIKDYRGQRLDAIAL